MSRYFYSLLFFLFVSCNTTTTIGELDSLNLEAAIDNRRLFDIGEIFDNIDLIALDSSQEDGLLGNIRKIAKSETGFYIMDMEWSVPVKYFDRTGKFVGTRGQIGRGPNEFLEILDMAVNYETNELYMCVFDGQFSLLAYDSVGNFFTRKTIDSKNGELSVYDDKVFLSKKSNLNSGNAKSTGNTMIPLLDVFSGNLQQEKTINVIDKGSGMILIEWKDASGMLNLSFGGSSRGILSNNGKTLMVKEERNDTVFYYRDGVLKPTWMLNFGKYAPPVELFEVNPTVSPDDSYLTQNILSSDNHIFVTVYNYKDRNDVQLIFERRNLAKGFTATDSGGKPGLFIDGIRFNSCYIRNNRLVGYMQAFDIVNNAAGITNPDLAALAATLKEDSNPVIVVAKLKK